MRSPILWQSLEEELEPAKPWVRGRLLNAGCGERDLSDFLRRAGADQVVNVDLGGSGFLDARSDLTVLPFRERSFDGILCNAVLEHVAEPDVVVAELSRVLKPGGMLILTVPFLQPFHASPTDYQRLTASGMEQLAVRHGLKLEQLRPVHSRVHTLSWIIWEMAAETGRRWLELALWLPIRLATWAARRSTPASTRHASAYQGVFRR